MMILRNLLKIIERIYFKIVSLFTRNTTNESRHMVERRPILVRGHENIIREEEQQQLMNPLRREAMSYFVQYAAGQFPRLGFYLGLNINTLRKCQENLCFGSTGHDIACLILLEYERLALKTNMDNEDILKHLVYVAEKIEHYKLRAGVTNCLNKYYTCQEEDCHYGYSDEEVVTQQNTE